MFHFQFEDCSMTELPTTDKYYKEFNHFQTDTQGSFLETCKLTHQMMQQ